MAVAGRASARTGARVRARARAGMTAERRIAASEGGGGQGNRIGGDMRSYPGVVESLFGCAIGRFRRIQWDQLSEIAWDMGRSPCFRRYRQLRGNFPYHPHRIWTGYVVCAARNRPPDAPSDLPAGSSGRFRRSAPGNRPLPTAARPSRRIGNPQCDRPVIRGVTSGAASRGNRGLRGRPGSGRRRRGRRGSDEDGSCVPACRKP